MKAILEFDLSDYDDRNNHMRCLKSNQMASALFDISYNAFRDIENQLQVNGQLDIIDAFNKKINDILIENNINIDELTR